jgi:hypothetical protein
MLAPPDLSTAQLKIALKPTAGFEQQLWASTGQVTNPGNIDLKGVNSGIYEAQPADVLQLAATPQEIVAVLDGPVNVLTSITATITGTDQTDSPLTGTATFSVPTYAKNQERVLPKSWGTDVVVAAGKKFKTITPGATVISCGAEAVPVRIKLFGIPSFDGINPATPGAYKLVSTKTKLDWDPRVPMPHPVQDGRDMSKFVKLGEIPQGTLAITQKIGSMGDGLMRFNGVRITGLVREFKEEQVETMRSYLLGLVISSKVSTAQSVEDAEATGEGIYEDVAVMLAGPKGI